MRDDRGQALVLFALGLAGFLAMVGLSVDIGRFMYTKTDLQKTADAAALAAAQDLMSASPDTSVARATANSYVTSNGHAAGNAVVTFSSTYQTNDTVTVAISENVNYNFLGFAGISNGRPAVTAKVVVQQATGFKFDDTDVFPYTVWGGPRTAGHNNSCPYNICIGSTQTYRSNQWDSDSFVTGPAWSANGNKFKGYFHHGTGITQASPTTWQTFSNGGNAMGQEPTDALDAHIASGKPIIVPVIAAAQCSSNCGQIDFKIVGWVALKITSRGNASTPWTGTVVNYSSPAGVGGGSTPPTSFPGVWSSSLVQ